MITFLNVPYADKDKVKKLGARWNQEKKSWYVENVDLIKFSKWIPEKYNDVDNKDLKTFAEWQKIFDEEFK